MKVMKEEVKKKGGAEKEGGEGEGEDEKEGGEGEEEEDGKAIRGDATILSADIILPALPFLPRQIQHRQEPQPVHPREAKR